MRTADNDDGAFFQSISAAGGEQGRHEISYVEKLLVKYPPDFDIIGSFYILRGRYVGAKIAILMDGNAAREIL